MSRQTEVGAGVAILVAWALHAWVMTLEYSFAIMLWSCHVATLILAFGLLAHRRFPVALATLFHIGVGFPAWLIESAVSARWIPTSTVVHTLPLLAGLWYLRGKGRLPRGTLPAAWAVHLLLVPVSRWLTAPGWNVNLAYGPIPVLQPYFSSAWALHVAAALATLTSLLLARQLLDFWLGCPRVSEKSL